MRLLLLLPLLLAAAMPATARPRRTAIAPPGQSALYHCGDGREIQVLYGGDDTAALTIGADTIVLSRDTQVARPFYAGKGCIWISTGAREGVVSRSEPADGARETACAVR